MNLEFYGGNFPFVKPNDLKNKFISESTEYLSEKGKNVSRILPKNSICVCCIGATIGKTSILSVEGTTNQQINSIVPIKLNPVYLYFAIKSSFVQHQFKSNAGKTTLPILNKTKFDNTLIPLPPLEEQKRIVAKIEEIFKTLEPLEED